MAAWRQAKSLTAEPSVTDIARKAVIERWRANMRAITATENMPLLISFAGKGLVERVGRLSFDAFRKCGIPHMTFACTRLSISTRRKLISVLLAVTIFALLAGLTTLAQGRPVIFGILNAIFVGTSVGLFEEFYVQTLRGRWMRSIHPIRSIIVYTIFVVIMFIVSINLTHILRLLAIQCG